AALSNSASTRAAGPCRARKDPKEPTRGVDVDAIAAVSLRSAPPGWDERYWSAGGPVNAVVHEVRADCARLSTGRPRRIHGAANRRSMSPAVRRPSRRRVDCRDEPGIARQDEPPADQR